MENVEIFIDAEYVLQSLRALKDKPSNILVTKNDFDWAKFIDLISNGRNVSKVYYYTARMDENENVDKYNDQTEYLKRTEESLASYNIQMRLGKMIKTRIKTQPTWDKDRKNKSKDNEMTSWVQKGIDSKIVLDLCSFAYTASASNDNVAIVVTGDEDFAETLQKLSDLQIGTELVAFRRNSYLSKNLMDSANSVTILDYKQLKQKGIV